MTLIALERSAVSSRRATFDEIPAARLDMLRQQVLRAVGHDGEHPIDQAAARVVALAITAFTEGTGPPARGARSVAPAFVAVGDHHARRGGDLDDLQATFDRALVVTQRCLQLVLGDTVHGHAVPRLREELMVFVRELSQHATAGWERTRRVLAMSEDARLDGVRAAVFGSGNDVAHLAELTGFDPAAEYVAVVSTGGPLPAEILSDPDVFAGEDPREALVPAGWDEERLSAQVESQVVLGPPSRMDVATDSVDLARRAAGFLRDGTVSDPRLIVPCSDLSIELVLGSNPVLGEILIAKHLGPLDAAPLSRRLPRAEMLLVWLERGLSIAGLARAFDIPPQTAYSRVKVLRQIFGDDLDDPGTRLELIVALRAALPRWRSEVG